jgi:hypothetical protein
MKPALSAVILILASLATGYSQITCNVNAVPPEVRDNGESELVGDLVMKCTSSGPPSSMLINIELFLNVPLTSRITNTVTQETENLLLIDDPQPGLPNVSNTFPYFGQVLGTLGLLAGDPGSGNVYQGAHLLDNTMVWVGVPYVTSGTRTFRLTNIRANTNVLGGPGVIEAVIAVTSDVSVSISGVPSTVAVSADGLKFKSTLLPASIGLLDLQFDELFPAAFKKRIENTILGPLTATHQDVPGVAYCTESGFTPEFSAVTPGAIGSANTGTRLLAEISNIPGATFVFVVPNEVTSSSGNLVAHRVLPPLGSDFSIGTVLTGGGVSLAFVTAAHTADLLYEVTAAAPFLGKNGCATLDSFHIPALGFFPAPLGAAVVKGHLAPVNPTAKASATAPQPRFVP